MNKEDIERDIAGFCRGFNECYERSDAKEQLLTEEIDRHELLFDDKRLPLPVEIHSSRRPIKGLRYTDGEILQIRESYNKYIVHGAGIADAGDYYYVKPEDIKEGDVFIEHIIEGDVFKDDRDVISKDSKGRTAKKFPPSDIELHYYRIASARWGYLTYLKSMLKPSRLKREEVITLEAACGDNTDRVKRWFVANDYCNETTFRYKDKKYTFQKLAGLLKALHTTGVCNKLSHADIKAIARNSFGIDMGEDTIKKAEKGTIDLS